MSDAEDPHSPHAHDDVPVAVHVENHRGGAISDTNSDDLPSIPEKTPGAEDPTQEEEAFLIPNSDSRSTAANVALLIVTIGLGMLEGAAFQRCGLFLPEAIGGQMVFKVWIVLKMFIASVGSSMLFQGVMRAFLGKDFDRSRHYQKKRAGFIRVICGSATLGVGMALSGGGPTMVPSQVGAGVQTSWATVLGMFVGGVVFAIIDKLAPALFAPPPADDFTLDRKVPAFRYEYVTIPLGLVMLGIATGLEFVVTQSDDEAALNEGPIPWPPTVAGVIVGLNQIPMRMIAGHGQGGSTSIMVMISTVTCGLLAPANRLTSFKQAWQLVFVWIGTTLGSLTSAQLNEPTYPDGYTYWRAIVGGAMMIFGARVAAGCTCGHGISGFAELSLESAVAVCAIFGAGIAAGFILEAAGSPQCCGLQ